MSRTVIVVPCYNEAERLDQAEWMRLAGAGKVQLLFVDDGSGDATRAVVEAMAAQHAAMSVLGLDRNRGKAEAVRQGMLRAIAEGAAVVGFLDADLSTDVDEALRLSSELAGAPEVQALLGSRVALAGRNIARDARRHYFGRVFSTIASLVLEAVVYDTQCGAKLFRVGAPLRAALADPFLSRWAFDIELIGRLLIGARGVPGIAEDAVLEVPLRRWVDVGGSKLSTSAMLRTTLELGQIRRDLVRRRAAVRAAS